MGKGFHRSRFGRLVDTIAFPFRALFIPYEGKFGLSSMRDERMGIAALYCKGKVLDVGCGPGNRFIKQFIGEQNGIGIDVYPYEGVEHVIDDMTNIPFGDCSFDTITLIAVGGHIPRSERRSQFRELSRLLKPGGRLLLTEGEPITQLLLHKWRYFSLLLLGKKDMDSERGMEDGEQYCMPERELISYLSTPPLRYRERKRFMWGLNNLYIATKTG